MMSVIILRGVTLYFDYFLVYPSALLWYIILNIHEVELAENNFQGHHEEVCTARWAMNQHHTIVNDYEIIIYISVGRTH